ncbi:hypothetical protein CERSUDRAFT_83486 [Gelatoporia subvermispora B]|uniref:DUF6534 domain-containing protein n=1 Tax=Ceriporiopsis subvermispora (strain B) TaxID=914234 RepID=M2QZS4_CERS8|nr:hypothetical protein CERSUDRAFT_83486 [Gelatoporia subvermispora B]
MDHDLRVSLAAILVGGLVSAALSGIVAMQTALYYRLFPRDPFMVKLRVGAMFLLDTLHTCMVCAASWQYLVESFGETNINDRVFWTVGVSIALTAITTVFVHLFFTYRLWKFSKGNYWITIPLGVMAVGRVGSAFVTAIELIKTGYFSVFYEKYRWVFTIGLVLSLVVDVSITIGLCAYLRKSRTGSGRLDHILDSVTLYTVENGMLTCITTVVSLIFWLAMPHVLIYLGLHFAISKLYANSFLASMNARKILRAQTSHASSSGHRLPVLFAQGFNGRISGKRTSLDLTGTRLQITVDKTVDCVVDDDMPPKAMGMSQHHSTGSTGASQSV